MILPGLNVLKPKLNQNDFFQSQFTKTKTKLISSGLHLLQLMIFSGLNLLKLKPKLSLHVSYYRNLD